MEKKFLGQILIECPNTIFQVYIKDESELSQIEIFMNNIKHIKGISVNDIYNWCNRHKFSYKTSFNYDKQMNFIKTIREYCFYFKNKIKNKNMIKCSAS